MGAASDPMSSPAGASPGRLRGSAGRRHRRNVLIAWLFGCTLAAGYAVLRDVPRAGWTTRDVTTGHSTPYPDLETRTYDSSPENTAILAAAVAERLPRWLVLRTDLGAGIVECRVVPRLALLADDVTIRVTPTGPGGAFSRVDVRSRCEHAPADLGANARNIRALQAGMDDKLPPVSL
jgi:hypothetical protein